jgi:polysaccharide export outer membrane protein
MGKRGHWIRMVPVMTAALGLCLAGLGCETLDGSYDDGGPPPGNYGGMTPYTPHSPSTMPYRSEPSGVVQTAYKYQTGSTTPQEVPGASGQPPMEVGPDQPPGVVLGAPHEAGPMPTELAKVSFPAYRVGPPDILILDAVRLLPRPPYRIEPLDVLTVVVTGTLEKTPIAGKFTVTPDGSINLGFGYGSVQVVGKTLQEAETAIQAHLARVLRNAQVAVSLDQMRIVQQVRGTHLVQPDGTIALGTYGCVYVAGMTIGEIKCAIEKQLSQWFLNPQVSVGVYAFNSKVYYVIFDGGGYGQQILAFPATGNETVLDAIAKTGGLPAVSSKKYIWVARPSPCGYPCDQVLPVDWNAVTQGGSTCTNYQLFPGDRVYVKADCLVATHNYLTKILAPVEDVLGVTLLGATTWETIRFAGSSSLTSSGVVAVP